jgi:hypothetical protein
MTRIPAGSTLAAAALLAASFPRPAVAAAGDTVIVNDRRPVPIAGGKGVR